MEENQDKKINPQEEAWMLRFHWLEKRFEAHVHAGQLWLNIFLFLAVMYCLIMITDIAIDHGLIPTLKWEYTRLEEESAHHAP
jgi:hypothetical protein